MTGFEQQKSRARELRRLPLTTHLHLHLVYFTISKLAPGQFKRWRDANICVLSGGTEREAIGRVFTFCSSLSPLSLPPSLLSLSFQIIPLLLFSRIDTLFTSDSFILLSISSPNDSYFFLMFRVDQPSFFNTLKNLVVRLAGHLL